MLLSEGLYEGYYEFVGQDAAAQLGHQMSSLVPLCLFLTTTGHHTEQVPCTQVGRIVPITSPEYYNCYTIEYLKVSACKPCHIFSTKRPKLLLFSNVNRKHK